MYDSQNCGDVLTKKKLDPHRNRCRGASFTCIDCMVYFPGVEYRAHTSCMSEEQKYQGALYKNKKQKTNPTTPQAPKPVETPKPVMAAAVIHQPLPQPAYVEDVPEDLRDYVDLDDDSDFDDDNDDSDDDAPPHAPTPPPADGGHVNVFDFLVQNGTPNVSNLNLPKNGPVKLSDSTQLVRFDYDSNTFLDQDGDMIDEKSLVRYGSGPIPIASLQTPAPKVERKKSKDGEKEVKKDKKRKRLHIDTHDQIMTDAPPVLHSGLTGGLKSLLGRPSQFPPSPEYSADAAETPASPLKKTKHSKHSKSRTETIGNNLISMLMPTTKPKTTKKKKSSSSPSKKKTRKSSDAKAPKLIEYRPSSKDSKDGSSQMVVFKPRADLLLSLINKGPESERGCSMNKALKRFHRERNDTGNSLGKMTEEKELWRSLRMRKNDRGEIVLFCADE